MGKFQQGNSGRPLGAKAKQPKRENLIKLCEYILSDLYENKEALTINDKIRILTIYKGLFEDATQTDSTPQPIVINMNDWK